MKSTWHTAPHYPPHHSVIPWQNTRFCLACYLPYLILSHYVNLVGTSATFSSLSLHCTRSSYTRRSPETRPSLLICRHGRLIYRTIYNPALQQLPTLPVLDFELPRSLWYKLYCDPPRRGIGTCQPDPLLHRDHTKKARSSRSAFSSGNNPRDIR